MYLECKKIYFGRNSKLPLRIKILMTISVAKLTILIYMKNICDLIEYLEWQFHEMKLIHFVVYKQFCTKISGRKLTQRKEQVCTLTVWGSFTRIADYHEHILKILNLLRYIGSELYNGIKNVRSVLSLRLFDSWRQLQS